MGDDYRHDEKTWIRGTKLRRDRWICATLHYHTAGQSPFAGEAGAVTAGDALHDESLIRGALTMPTAFSKLTPRTAEINESQYLKREDHFSSSEHHCCYGPATLWAETSPIRELDDQTENSDHSLHLESEPSGTAFDIRCGGCILIYSVRLVWESRLGPVRTERV